MYKMKQDPSCSYIILKDINIRRYDRIFVDGSETNLADLTIFDVFGITKLLASGETYFEQFEGFCEYHVPEYVFLCVHDRCVGEEVHVI